MQHRHVPLKERTVGHQHRPGEQACPAAAFTNPPDAAAAANPGDAELALAHHRVAGARPLDADAPRATDPQNACAVGDATIAEHAVAGRGVGTTCDGRIVAAVHAIA